ncbi:MAG: lipopolysaccharide biosynthesis protein [Betaproteobacteria bacterium]
MQFFKSGAIYAAANFAAAAVPFLLLPLLTRVLRPDEFARVVTFMLVVGLCQATAGLNVNAALGVAWFKRTRPELQSLVGTAVLVAIASSLLSASVVALLFATLPGVGGGMSPGWGAVAAIAAGANVVLQCRLVLWQSQHKAWQCAVLQIGVSTLNVGLSLFAVLILQAGDYGRNAAIATSFVIGSVVAVVSMRWSSEIRFSPQAKDFHHLLSLGLPLIAHSLAGALLSTADRWVVAIRLDGQQLGVYGAGAQLGMAMALVADAFTKAYTPWLYSKLKDPQPTSRYAAVGAVFISVPGFLLLAALVGCAIYLLSLLMLGERYQGASQLLPWFMLGGAATGVYVSASAFLFYEGRAGLLALLTSAAAVCGACLTWLLVGRFAQQGAAAGYALTQFILATFALVVAIRTVALPWTELRVSLRHISRLMLNATGEHNRNA